MAHFIPSHENEMTCASDEIYNIDIIDTVGPLSSSVVGRTRIVLKNHTRESFFKKAHYQLYVYQNNKEHGLTCDIVYSAIVRTLSVGQAK